MAAGSGASYSSTAKFFHWTVALLVLTIVPVGILMGRIPGNPMQNNLYTLHKSIGVLILVLMTLRIIYRLSHGAPAPEPTLKPWERAASGTVHWFCTRCCSRTRCLAHSPFRLTARRRRFSI